MEGEITIKLNLSDVKRDLLQLQRSSSERGLLHSSKWLLLFVNLFCNTYYRPFVFGVAHFKLI